MCVCVCRLKTKFVQVIKAPKKKPKKCNRILFLGTAYFFLIFIFVICILCECFRMDVALSVKSKVSKDIPMLQQYILASLLFSWF
jgi:hypothetical protein